jgi:hypothetical protein
MFRCRTTHNQPHIVACVLTLATLTGAGCVAARDAGVGVETPADATQVPADASPASLSGVALAHAADLRTGVRLGEWRSRHAADVVRLRAGGRGTDAPRLAEQSNSNWCARADGEVQLADGRTALRSVYFYAPAPAADAALPDAAGGRVLTDECRLGLVWVETAHPPVDHEAGPADADVAAAAEELTGALGAAGGMQPHWWGSAYWRGRARWQADLIAAVGARRDPWDDARDLAFVIVAGPAADLSGPGWQVAEPLPERWELRQRAVRRRLTEALDILGSGSGLRIADEMRVLAARADSMRSWQEGEGLPQAVRDEFPRVLGNAVHAWSGALPALPAGQRAAALLAMDLLLHGADDVGRPDQTALRRTFEDAGGIFDYSPLGDWHVYTRSWLKRAAQESDAGRASELAFLTLLELGFETSATCSETGPFSFLEVIRRGDEYLARTPQSSIRAGVHLALARAWSDIVALAMGMGYEEGDGDQFVEQAPHARVRAAEHYRLAFDTAAEDDLVRLAWPDAWRMVAGLDPSRTWFYCVYD